MLCSDWPSTTAASTEAVFTCDVMKFRGDCEQNGVLKLARLVIIELDLSHEVFCMKTECGKTLFPITSLFWISQLLKITSNLEKEGKGGRWLIWSASLFCVRLSVGNWGAGGGKGGHSWSTAVPKNSELMRETPAPPHQTTDQLMFCCFHLQRNSALKLQRPPPPTHTH